MSMTLAPSSSSAPADNHTPNRLRVVVVLPDGVGVRNFVHGGFLRLLSEEAEVLVLHTMPEAGVRELTGANYHLAQWRRLAKFSDRPDTFVLRKCLSYAQMYWVDTPSMRVERNRRVSGAFKYRAVSKAAQWLGRCFAFPRGIRWLDRLHARRAAVQPEVAEYRRVFEDFCPDVLFCSHQRPNQVISPVLAAKSLNIPTASFIFSWDNLTSKGRIAAPFDHYLVWSGHMRDELLQFYPDVPPQNAHLVGTPQFDPYNDPALALSREAFFALFGGDAQRKLICFSGGVPETHSADTAHVRDLLELIRAGKIEGRPQVLVRPAPVDLTGRFARLQESYPELLVAQPDWIGCERESSWELVIPRPTDTQFLCNLARHADINVNFGSTMTLDFAIHDRPVVNVVYDVAEPFPLGMPLWDFVRLFDHYRPVIELGAARFAHSASELADHVNAYLRNPALDKENRKKFVDLEISQPIGTSSPRIVEVLRQIAQQSPRHD